MRLKYIFILTVFLLASCQQDDALPTDVGTGYLSLASIEVQAASKVSIPTRAVDAALAIEIWNEAGDTQVKSFDAGDTVASQKIELEAGNYLLKTYSPNYNTAYTNDEKGDAKYYAEQTFSIQEERVTYVDVAVPITNFGVKLTLPDSFGTHFSSYTFTVELGSRSISLANGETAYFDAPTETDNYTLAYSFTATNTDNETMTQTGSYTNPLSGKMYEITYSYATRALACGVSPSADAAR